MKSGPKNPPANRTARRQEERNEEYVDAVLLEDWADLVFGSPIQERERHLRAIEGRNRDQVEAHQDEVDEHEVVQRVEQEARLARQLRVGIQVAQRNRRGSSQDQVGDWTGGSNDGLSAPSEPEGHRIDRGGLGPAEPEPSSRGGRADEGD